MAGLNLLSSSNKFRPAAPPLSPGVPETEPREGEKIIKDILCQEHLSGGSLAVPTGEGGERGAEKEVKGEGDRRRKSEGAGLLLLCAFPSASPAPLRLLLN